MESSLRFALVATVIFVLLPAIDAKADDGFTDITKESGIEAVIETHYLHQPKWWLTGTNLIDLDHDGHLDLFIGAHGQTAAVALNDGHGHFRYVEPSPNLPPTEIHLACDTAGNGTVNLQMTYQDGGGRWYHNSSTPGTPQFDATKIISDQGRENAMIDLDRDGNLDWIHEDGRKAAIVFELGDGKGGFHPSGGFATFKEASAIPVDFDGDGFIDLVLKQCGYNDEHAGHARIMMNDGHSNFADRTTDCGLVPDGVVVQGVGDVNQDGFVDLICFEHGRDVAIYLNDGKAHFKKLDDAVSGMDQAHKPIYANWGLAVVIDLDNDGIPDILMNGRSFLYVLHGTGGGHFTYANKTWNVPDFSWSAVDEGLCFGDIDNDGRLDLVVSSGTEKHKTMSVLHNDLPPRHWINVRLIGAGGNRPAAGAKIRLLEPATGKLLSYEQVVIAGRQTAHSYYEYGTTERHFGLGDRETVDIQVEFYPSGKVLKQSAIKVNQTVQVAE